MATRRTADLQFYLLIGSILATASGCTLSLPRWNLGGWLADFDEAERRVVEDDQELLILYTGGNPGRKSPLRQAFESTPLARAAEGRVCCVLLRSYEPDRRYVAQYGVNRPPAIVLVHRDGTYHARTGPMTPDDILAFLTSAKPPGTKPVYNPHIPRRARYQWQDDLEPAMAQATSEGKPLLVAYYRTLSRDWRRLKKMLYRHEVCSRLDDLIHCRVAVLGFSKKKTVTPFGALQLPALVIVRTDGKHDVLELPTSYEAVALFAEETLTAETQPGSTLQPTSFSPGANAVRP